MYLQIFKNRGIEYVRILESYRDPKTKKPRVRVIQNFGNKEKLLAQNPNAIQELQEKVEQMNKEKEISNASTVAQNLQQFIESNSSLIKDEGAPIQNYGYEIYQMLWDELKLDQFLQYRQKKETRIEFPVKIPVALMTFSRLLFPESKLSTYEGKDRFARDFPCSLDHMYRSLAFLASQKDNLEKHLHKQISKKITGILPLLFTM